MRRRCGRLKCRRVDNALLIHRYGPPANPMLKDEPPCPATAAPKCPAPLIFLTVNLLNRHSDLLVRHIDLLRKTVSHPLTPPFTCRAIPSAASRNLHHRRYNLA